VAKQASGRFRSSIVYRDFAMVDIELRELRLFLALAEELHFGRTAERLGLTTSRASQTLRALEPKPGGQRLFDRTSRVVTLTAAGHALHGELAPIVTGLDNTLSWLTTWRCHSGSRCSASAAAG
jgi:DNA-binding transcriptional LysR family regulator